METEEAGRRRETPKLRWRYSAKRDLERAAVNSSDWERMAEDWERMAGDWERMAGDWERMAGDWERMAGDRYRWRRLIKWGNKLRRHESKDKVKGQGHSQWLAPSGQCRR